MEEDKDSLDQSAEDMGTLLDLIKIHGFRWKNISAQMKNK